MTKAARSVAAAEFIEPMECLPVKQIADGPEWTYEILCCAQQIGGDNQIVTAD